MTRIPKIILAPIYEMINMETKFATRAVSLSLKNASKEAKKLSIGDTHTRFLSTGTL